MSGELGLQIGRLSLSLGVLYGPHLDAHNGAEGGETGPRAPSHFTQRTLTSLYSEERILQVNSWKLPDQTVLTFPF